MTANSIFELKTSLVSDSIAAKSFSTAKSGQHQPLTVECNMHFEKCQKNDTKIERGRHNFLTSHILVIFIADKNTHLLFTLLKNLNNVSIEMTNKSNKLKQFSFMIL